MMHYWYTDNWGMGWMAVWWLVSVAAIGVALWFVLSVARRGGGPSEPPEETLKRRYAKGDIDRETYERILEDLHK